MPNLNINYYKFNKHFDSLIQISIQYLIEITQLRNVYAIKPNDLNIENSVKNMKAVIVRNIREVY